MLKMVILGVVLFNTAALADCLSEIPPEANPEQRAALQVYCREQELIRKKHHNNQISDEEAALMAAQSSQRAIKADADRRRADNTRDANEAAAAAAMDAAGSVNNTRVCQNYRGTSFCY